jgi:hypothetical protein
MSGLGAARDTLLTQLKMASGIDRSIDASLFRLDDPGLAASAPWPKWIEAQEQGRDDFAAIDRYTSSVDQALRLATKLLPGFRFCLYTNGEGKGPCCIVLKDDLPVYASEHGANLPLAILASMLVTLSATK